MRLTHTISGQERFPAWPFVSDACTVITGIPEVRSRPPALHQDTLRGIRHSFACPYLGSMWNASAMPFYLEYTINQNADIRSAVDGSNREEALARAADTVRESGCRTALLAHRQHVIRQW